MKSKQLKTIYMLLKVFIVQLVFCCFAMANEGYTQSIKDIYLEWDSAKQVEVLEIFEEIENQTAFKFNYDEKDVNRQTELRISRGSHSVYVLLEKIGKVAPLNFKRMNNTIAVTPRPEKEVPEITEKVVQQTVTGNVTDDAGTPLPGVNVLEKGTSNGTSTDFDGNYSISVSNGAVLVFSSLGFTAQEVAVGGQSTINVTLGEDAQQLGEVVVTALGIKREEKTLTYAQQTVSADEITKTRDVNFLNSINGKTAGVEIKKSSSGAGGSTKIVLRGNKSLTGDSTPLFVIDGIPLANNRGGQPGMWGGTDSGDGISALNPDDIASISILRGANAALLYGSAGANGVVLITTKEGEAGKTTVSLNSGVTFESIIETPDLQFKYGAIGEAKESWDTTPGNYASGYVDDFFSTGANWINSISVSGGNDRTTAYFSYSNTTATGITPENTYSRNNVSFKQSTKLLDDKLTVSSNIILSIENSENRLPSGYYLNPLTGLYFFPRNRDFADTQANFEIFDPARNLMAQNWFVNDHHQSNPYWIIHRQPREQNNRRVIANLTLNYQLMDQLNLQVRGNYDYANVTREQRHAATSNPTNVNINGTWDYHKYEDRLIYTDAILTYDNDLSEDFSLTALVGGSYTETDYGDGVRVTPSSGNGLIYPNEFNFQNLALTQTPVRSVTNGVIKKQGLFANATLGYKEMLFLDLGGRNDWASTLALTGNDSYFYPSVGITAIVSEMFEMPEAISFAKFRVSQTQVANEVPFNRINPQNSISDPVGSLTRNTTKPFTDAEPEIITSTEIGADWRFFGNRLGIDFTYYHIKSEDQFITVPLDASDPESEGRYTQKFINAGEIVNRGVEISLNGTPVRNDGFEWNTAFNITRNRSEIVDIGPDDERIINLGSSEGYSSRLVEGGRFNDLYVLKFRRDDQGRILFDDNGNPLRTPERELIGNLDPDFTLGWNNTVSFGRWSASALINGVFGGKVFSQTESMLDGAGVSQRTADARDAGSVAVNGVVESSGAAVTSVDPEQWFRFIGDRNGVGEAYVYDRTNIRLAQLSLGYDIDLAKLNMPFIKAASISFIGNNLFFFKKDAPFDPELAMSTNRNSVGLDNFNLPSTRNYGLNLKVTF
ncbi:SusC/RagA family TonB-linked outer membrane protein [Flagellimonas myxillae]|uniref:SusC/RagA family TonB-linked outer membrane protein n=1 Tax=Flagellimonas myxillae TaxID=2942214 RepID=UPI00201F7300|nr:SusC/RagA family TonB-linked outer membrane protein [Muricauda myxillae]MCL6265448.1 SusC/RagA family TonB-linked outer membrane protein [Muricauda myxillae]